MTAKEALSYAIHAEIEANEFYLEWSINTNDPAAKKELQELADWEAQHRDQLTNIYEADSVKNSRETPTSLWNPR